jgi:2-succinyl-6-hydroxy-2,4-cyclohexadiene-1-carboxylate synthase
VSVPPGWIDLGSGDGIPLVALHGFLGDPRDLEPMLTYLSLGRRIVAPILPFHGPDPEPVPLRGNGFIAAVDHLAARLELAGIPRMVAMGYSMGGRLVYGLLARHPHRIAGAVLVGATPGISDAADRRTRIEADRERARAIVADLPTFLDRWYAQPLFHGLREHPEFEAMRARRLTHDPHALAQALLTMGTGVQPALWEELAEIRVPLLLVAGERDHKFRRTNETAAGQIPTARVEVVDGCSHAVHLERPREMANLITTFVEERCER